MGKIKFWVGLAGAVVTTLLQVLGPAGDVGKWLTIAAAVLTAIGVYAFPNQESARVLEAKAKAAREDGRY